MPKRSEIHEKIKTYIQSEVIEGALPSELTNATSLITIGVLDSIATMRLVGFLEQEFLISIEAQDIQPNHFDSIDSIAEFVASKLTAKEYR
jgi:acyl carrier protein